MCYLSRIGVLVREVRPFLVSLLLHPWPDPCAPVQVYIQFKGISWPGLWINDCWGLLEIVIGNYVAKYVPYEVRQVVQQAVRKTVRHLAWRTYSRSWAA